MGVLWQFHNSVHEANEPMSQALLNRMNFSGNEYNDFHAYIVWRLEKYPQTNHYGWVSHLDDNKEYVTSYNDSRPCQFQYGQLSTMSSIYDMKGKGWSKMSDQKIKQFFRTPADTVRETQRTTSITTLHQYEENMIILKTMKDMKKCLYGPNNQF